MKETIKLGMILLIITVVSAGVLAVSNNLTKDKIEEIKIAENVKALEELFGGGYEFNNMDEERQKQIISDKPIIEIFEAYKDQTLEGYAIKTLTPGYGGDLIVLTAISKADGQILGMRLLDHKETQAIGSKAADPEYEDKFKGKDIKEEITDTISGATITSTGVLKGVNMARELYNTKLAN